MTDWLGLPELASAHGGQIDAMIGWVHVFMLILFVGWGAFFTYCLVRFRRSRQPVANYTGVKSHTSSYLEVGVALVEAVLLFGFAIPLWAARVGDMPPAKDALLVQVTGEQFAWNVHYAGPDGVFGRTDIKLLDLQSNPLGIDRDDPAAKDDVTTVNQLYLPVNKPVIVRLRSKDVIHSFGVPEFRVKQDAIPGLTIPIWFVPTVTTAEMRTRTGKPEFQYQIACAQLCGLGHARMRGFVTVQTRTSSRSGWTRRSRRRARRTRSAADDSSTSTKRASSRARDRSLHLLQREPGGVSNGHLDCCGARAGALRCAVGAVLRLVHPPGEGPRTHMVHVVEAAGPLRHRPGHRIPADTTRRG